jgi:hypothetical protein
MESLKISFDLFGDEQTASSRLRGFKLARELTKLGHVPIIGNKGVADLKVFQKNLNFKELGRVRESGAIVIYDFDDNYLLEGVGTRSDVIRFMNFADVVTAGSDLLVESAKQYHPRVYLFENPLDVIDEDKCRGFREWEHRLAWFGNSGNLPALEALGLSQRVTTITTNGDIPWQLATIDDELINFDLVLIPVLTNEWTLSKNANRMLKCIALGVPFLASNTPEHRRMAERLGLPAADFLVAEGESWTEKIDACILSSKSRHAAIMSARTHALEMFGIQAVTRRWLENILALARATNFAPVTVKDSVKDFALDLDVVVLSQNEPGRLERTLQSLRLEEVSYHSVTVVSALPITSGAIHSMGVKIIDCPRDFFEIFDLLCDAFHENKAGRTLYLNAGVRLTHGFLEEASSRASGTEISLFCAQESFPEFGLLPLPPTSVWALLSKPFIPHALLIQTALLQKFVGLSRPFSCFCMWDLLIRAFDEVRVSLCPAPVITVDAASLEGDPVASYANFLAQISPKLPQELPDLGKEWQRLEATLVSRVIEAHHPLFARYASTLIPQLLGRQSAIARQAKQTRRKHRAELMKALASVPPGRKSAALSDRTPAGTV